MFRFEELEIWRLAVDYAKDCYKIAEEFPRHETYALADQLRRASISISNNIVEGSVGSGLNFRKYLNFSVGSALETLNIINFAFEVGYVKPEKRNEMYGKGETIIKMTRSFAKTLK